MSCMSRGEHKKSLNGGWGEEEPSPTCAFQKEGGKSNFSKERDVKKAKEILGLYSVRH